MTNNGDLDSEMGHGGFTVGQELCLGAQDHGHSYSQYETVSSFFINEM